MERKLCKCKEPLSQVGWQTRTHIKAIIIPLFPKQMHSDIDCSIPRASLFAMPVYYRCAAKRKKKLQRGGISQILSVSDGQSEIESGSVLFFAVHIGFPCLHKSDSPNKPDRKSDRDIFYGLHT